MPHASYINEGNIYTILMIDDTSKIETDMESVKDTISDTDPIVYRENMVQSISQGLAYEIYKNEDRVGFVYNRIDEYRYLGCSICVWDNIGMLLTMKTMFEICDKHKIEFAPHTSNLKYFKSMIQGNKIREYNNGAIWVSIMRDDMVSKGLQMFKYLGLEQV